MRITIIIERKLFPGTIVKFGSIDFQEKLKILLAINRFTRDRNIMKYKFSIITEVICASNGRGISFSVRYTIPLPSL